MYNTQLFFCQIYNQNNFVKRIANVNIRHYCNVITVCKINHVMFAAENLPRL